ncbi:uncharacterized protein [Henckelia pumila]|uniref:uncharacterized protein n=1 Tax=Henckelia pumila TaxID=405737 RepID=UPI003C6DFBB8
MSCNGSTSYSQPTIQMEQQELRSQFGVPFSYNFNENELVSTQENPNPTGQILMHLDPWISPFSARVRESIFKLDLLHDQVPNPTPNHMINVDQQNNIVSTLPIHDSLSVFESHSGIFSNAPLIPSPGIPHQQPVVMDQALLNFPNQMYNANSDALAYTQQPAPRFMSSTTVPNGNIEETPQIICHGIDQNDLPYENLKWSELANMQGEDYTIHLANNNLSVIGGDANYSKNCVGVHKDTDQSVEPFKDVHPNEDNFVESLLGMSKNLTSGQWEWEDFLLDDNINMGDFTKL